MSITLVSDIFGITPGLLRLKEEIGAETIVDPYNGQSMAFNNEADAYSHFVSTVGLEGYVSILFKALETLKKPTSLIGFSVGASAVWSISSSNERNLVKQAYCFYGSQIRNHTEIVPCYQTKLVFPQSELHFDVAELIHKLTNKANVSISQVKYLHGFMNYHSTNFNEKGYKDTIALLQSMISN
jgi:dienelactone hydrolase